MFNVIDDFRLSNRVLENMANRCDGDQDQIRRRLHEEYKKIEEKIEKARGQADRDLHDQGYFQRYYEVRDKLIDLNKKAQAYLTLLDTLKDDIEYLSLIGGYLHAAEKSSDEYVRIQKLWEYETTFIPERRVLHEELSSSIKEPGKRGRHSYLRGMVAFMLEVIKLYEATTGKKFTIFEHRVDGQPQPVTEGQWFAYEACAWERQYYTMSNFQTACIEALKKAKKRHS